MYTSAGPPVGDQADCLSELVPVIAPGHAMARKDAQNLHDLCGESLRIMIVMSRLYPLTATVGKIKADFPVMGLKPLHEVVNGDVACRPEHQ